MKEIVLGGYTIEQLQDIKKKILPDATKFIADINKEVEANLESLATYIENNEATAETIAVVNTKAEEITPLLKAMQLVS